MVARFFKNWYLLEICLDQIVPLVFGQDGSVTQMYFHLGYMSIVVKKKRF